MHCERDRDASAISCAVVGVLGISALCPNIVNTGLEHELHSGLKQYINRVSWATVYHITPKRLKPHATGNASVNVSIKANLRRCGKFCMPCCGVLGGVPQLFCVGWRRRRVIARSGGRNRAGGTRWGSTGARCVSSCTGVACTVRLREPLAKCQRRTCHAQRLPVWKLRVPHATHVTQRPSRSPTAGSWRC